MKRNTLLLVPLVIAVAYSCNPKGTGIDLFSGSSGLSIAYNVAVPDSSGTTNYEVFTMNTDGSEVRNITNNPDVAWTYRCYDKELYFISDRDTSYRCFFLYRTDYKGDNVQKISHLRLEDSWMDFRNDGKEAVVSGRLGTEVRYQLFIIDTKTGSYKQVTHDTSSLFIDPVFSPDGKLIVAAKKSRRDRTVNEELYQMNADGSGLKQLTHYPQDNISRDSSGYKAGSPHWHPSGNFISYISFQDGKHSIFAVTPDGEKQWKLTENDFSEGWHDWSPDGNWLTFDMASENNDQYHIMLMNMKSGELRQITGSEYRVQLAPTFIRKY
jgi:TolB protein